MYVSILEICLSGERFLEGGETQWARFKYNENVERLFRTV